ncbi:neuropeptide-like protein 32 [Zeugodacus cucurbitae]|uniref:neuropeptide-like protein 32 n=1 Tax=Zeugodacus cucurbitae TaxID=28588 RepID=UPI0023D8EE1F|nr:neuropeptide-like protein 32 [Zeugodacus cucurbitae]
MRAISICLVLVLFVAIVTLEAAQQPLSLIDIDAQQGHENEGDRLTRQYGSFGGRGSWGGFGRFGGRGGYGGYGGYGRRGGHWG